MNKEETQFVDARYKNNFSEKESKIKKQNIGWRRCFSE